MEVKYESFQIHWHFTDHAMICTVTKSWRYEHKLKQKWLIRIFYPTRWVRQRSGSDWFRFCDTLQYKMCSTQTQSTDNEMLKKLSISDVFKYIVNCSVGWVDIYIVKNVLHNFGLCSPRRVFLINLRLETKLNLFLFFTEK